MIVQSLTGSQVAHSVAHSGETGFRVTAKPPRVHSASSGKYVLVTVHAKRGTEGMDAAGVLPSFAGIACHRHRGSRSTATATWLGTPCVTPTCCGS